MATNVQKLASQIRDIYSGGNPNSNTRVTQGQIELLIVQVAPALRVKSFREMYDQFGVHIIDGKFVKPYTITLTTGGTNWKKAALPAAYLTLPTNRGVAFVLEPNTFKPIEVVDKALFANLAGGIVQSSGGYYAIPLSDYIEIRGGCNKTLPRIGSIEIGLVVPDETLADEALDYIIIEEVLKLLSVMPFPDKNINANPQ
jgi:hypothetical protein